MSNVTKVTEEIKGENVVLKFSEFRDVSVVFAGTPDGVYVERQSVKDLCILVPSKSVSIEVIDPMGDDRPIINLSNPAGNELFFKTSVVLSSMRLAELPKFEEFEQFVNTITFDSSPTNTSIH